MQVYLPFVFDIFRPFGSCSTLAQNTCFGMAHIGAGLCISSRILPRKGLSCSKVALLSASGSVLFNYGTMLVLANVKHYLPQSELIRCAIGLVGVSYMLWVGREFLDLLGENDQDSVD